MLKQKDLFNKAFVGRDCVGFELPIANGDKTIFTKAVYTKLDEITWRIELQLDKTDRRDRIYYDAVYTMPKTNMPITTVATTGLWRIRSMMIDDSANIGILAANIASMTDLVDVSIENVMESATY